MGNNITFIGDFEDASDSGEIEVNIAGDVSDYLNNALQAIDTTFSHSSRRHMTNLPVIRKRPDMTKFVDTELYKQIKASCGLPPTNKLPCERWSLMRGIQKRENGLAAPRSASFTLNQQRSIANLFIPNQKESRLMSFDSKIFVCKYNKDGSKLLTATKDGQIRIFDASKGTYHRVNRITARDVNWSILDADFSPCGQYFAYTTWSKSFFIMPTHGNADDCRWIDLNCNLGRSSVFSVRYSPDGRHLVGGSNNSMVFVSDIETRTTTELRTYRFPTMDVNSVVYVSNTDPNVIMAGCDNGLLALFDLRAHNTNSTNFTKFQSQFVGHFDGITYIDPLNDGYHVLSNSKDQSIKIWDIRKPTTERVPPRQDMVEWDYRWDSVPHQFYNPKRLKPGDVSIMTFRGHRVSKTLLRAKFSPAEQTGSRFIYTGCATGRIIIYDVLTGKIREAIEGHKNVLRDLDWHPVRSEIVSSSWDTHVNLNIFRRNAAVKTSQPRKRAASTYPLRRSRRLADRNIDLPPTNNNDPPSDVHDDEGPSFSKRQII